MLLIFNVLLFEFLLLPVGQCDTDQGSRRYNWIYPSQTPQSGLIGGIVSITGNFGAGIPAGPLPANAALGISNTFILKDF